MSKNKCDKSHEDIYFFINSSKLMNLISFYRWTDVNMTDLMEVLNYSGFRKLALKYTAFGLKEMAKSLIIPLQINGIQRFIKGIYYKDIETGPSGVRAQAMAEDGKYFILTTFLST